VKLAKILKLHNQTKNTRFYLCKTPLQYAINKTLMVHDNSISSPHPSLQANEIKSWKYHIDNNLLINQCLFVITFFWLRSTLSIMYRHPGDRRACFTHGSSSGFHSISLIPQQKHCTASGKPFKFSKRTITFMNWYPKLHKYMYFFFICPSSSKAEVWAGPEKFQKLYFFRKSFNKRPMGHTAHLSNLNPYRNIIYAFHFHLSHPTLGGHGFN
jgi:hypothetical protein